MIPFVDLAIYSRRGGLEGLPYVWIFTSLCGFVAIWYLYKYFTSLTSDEVQLCSNLNITESSESTCIEKDVLDLSGRSLDFIHRDRYDRFNSLTVLDVSMNQIKTLPLKLPPSLEKLHLGWNLLSEFPRSVLQLPKLRWLHIANNPIKLIPRYITKLKDLQQLYLWSCYLKSVPSEIGELEKLEVLDISHNKIRKFPKGISRLEQLKWLDVNDNKLSNIPQDIAGLQHLEVLRVHKNKLETIPIGISQLFSLTELNVSNNQLTVIPHFVTENLTKLKIFDIRHNGIKRLPSFHRLIQLECFEFVRNPIQEPPTEVCELGIDAILQYQQDIRLGASCGRRQLVFVVGESEVGKTSFCESLKRGEACVMAKGDHTTVLNELFIDDEDLQFHFWDFGGQEVYKVLCQVFLRPDAVVILMFDLSKYDCSYDVYFNTIGVWLRKLQSQILGVRVLLVGSKSDLLSKGEVKKRIKDVQKKVSSFQKTFGENIRKRLTELDQQSLSERRSEEGKDLSEKRKDLKIKLESAAKIEEVIFTISSIKYQGIPEIRVKLVEIAEEMALKLPSNWVMFADQMTRFRSQVSTGYMSKDETYEIWKDCQRESQFGLKWRKLATCTGIFTLIKKFGKNCPETDERGKFETQLGFLHRWGCILWYGRESQLSDSVIHDPRRMIDFMKKVFNTGLPETLTAKWKAGLLNCTESQFTREMGLLKRGILVPQLIGSILVDFEESEQKLMFSLLQEFGLCYNVSVGSESGGFHFPWFLSNKEEPLDLPSLWPGCPQGTDEIQLQVEFHFLMVVPLSFFEKIQGRLHSENCSLDGAHRRDWSNGMFTRMGNFKALIKKVQGCCDGKVTVGLRGKIGELSELWKVLVNICTLIQKMMVDYPGETSDIIYVCPGCLQDGSEKPLTLPWNRVVCPPNVSSKYVPCHKEADAQDIPAALHYPVLLVKTKDATNHKKPILEYGKALKKKGNSTQKVMKGASATTKRHAKKVGKRKSSTFNLTQQYCHNQCNISNSRDVHVGDTNYMNQGAGNSKNL